MFELEHVLYRCYKWKMGEGRDSANLCFPKCFNRLNCIYRAVPITQSQEIWGNRTTIQIHVRLIEQKSFCLIQLDKSARALLRNKKAMLHYRGPGPK